VASSAWPEAVRWGWRLVRWGVAIVAAIVQKNTRFAGDLRTNHDLGRPAARRPGNGGIMPIDVYVNVNALRRNPP